MKEWYDYVTDIDYNRHKVNPAEYGEYEQYRYKNGKQEERRRKFWFLNNLLLRKKI